jgi:aminodeoxyfutalosine deaminase
LNLDPALDAFIREMPKVELHVHLEGSMRPETLLQLAKRHRVSLPADTVEGLREWFRFRDFEHFVEIYLTCSRSLRDPEDFQLVAREFLAQQAAQNIRYSEVHFTVATHIRNGANGNEVATALNETLQEEEKRLGVRARWIPDIVRDVPWKWADKTLEWALDGRRYGVVALGLSGFEASPDEPFREHFRVARQEGLHRVAHAGEHEGPASIHSAIEVCEPERIGHGIRAIEDAELLEQLVESRIPLEICPTSNVCLGAAADLESHPIDAIRRSGVAVSVNSDDPPLFETTLTDEFRRLSETFGYGAPELAALSWAALRQAFVSGEERRGLEDEYRRLFRSLGDRHLGDAAILERHLEEVGTG